MAQRRKLLIAAILAAILAAAGLFFWLRTTRIPEAARLVPEGNLVVYANLRPIHFWLSQSQPVQPQGEYRDFVEQTGIVLERDLDEVAMSRSESPAAAYEEWSEVYVGRFDQQRLVRYLEKLARERTAYRDHIIYTIPHEGHSTRVTVLDSKRVAVTNMNSPEPIRAIIDASYNPPAGPSLLREYYNRVPLTSLGWIVARFPPASKAQIASRFSFDFLDNTVTVASVRYRGNLLVQADVIAPSDEDAHRIVDDASSFLTVSRGAAQALGARGVDRDVKAAFDSIQVQQKKNVAVFTATLSQRMLKKLVSDEAGPKSAAPVPSP